MDSNEVSLPLIHEHLMVPWNDLRKGDCCGCFESISDGFYCKICDFFFHKKCSESSEYISHPSHSHTLRLQTKQGHSCDLCSRGNLNLFYGCEMCDFDMDLSCIKYPPPEVIEISKMHDHKLTLLKEWIEVDCSAKCGMVGEGFTYKCHECDIDFHVGCVWNPTEAKYPSEVNHTYHSLHPLKLHTGQPVPDYSDGRCRLCARKIDDKLFYHCAPCNFTLDMRCVLNPPQQSLMNLKAHDHQLTLLPRLGSYICNACGLNGDRSPFICVQCDFMIHQNCLKLPRLININRHDHRVSRTSVLGVVNSVCGICREKVDWTRGGFSCQKCPEYVVHSKCATRIDMWDGKELEGVPEETEDIEPYVMIDDNTIKHFSHKEHYLKLVVNDVLCDENKRCRACTHPICHQSFYTCMDCDFILHQNCAGFRRRKRNMLYGEQLSLVTSEANVFVCSACHRCSNGFRYKIGDDNGFRYEFGDGVLDVRCASISDPFYHPSHPDHLLYYLRQDEKRHCSGCNEFAYRALMCIEDGCDFQLDFKCATTPQVVQHSIYDDHLLSLRYGKKASRKHWCGMCEKEINISTWFYTCKDGRDSLHISCVVGDFLGLMPRTTIKLRSISFEVVLNNGVSRPFCRGCKSRCLYPMMLKMLETWDPYICSIDCLCYVLQIASKELLILELQKNPAQRKQKELQKRFYGEIS